MRGEGDWWLESAARTGVKRGGAACAGATVRAPRPEPVGGSKASGHREVAKVC